MKNLTSIFIALVILCSASAAFADYSPSINIFPGENGIFGSKKETAETLPAFSSLEGVIESANRYGEADCNTIIGQANMERTHKFKINTSNVDFGDEVHMGGTPLSRAVICWATNGRVAVKGKLFSDNWNQQIAIAQIKFHSTSSGWSGYTSFSTTLASGWVANRVVQLYTVPGGFDKVRIRLKKTTYSALGPTTSIINTWTYNR